ncbi:MAG: hypothetical protein AVDCRST_MAG53-3338, partial [uncultured Solirubrobacteraceae bacterium]
ECILTLSDPHALHRRCSPRGRPCSRVAALRRARHQRHPHPRGREGERHLAGLPLPPVPHEGRPRHRADRAHERARPPDHGRGRGGGTRDGRAAPADHGQGVRGPPPARSRPASPPAPRPRRLARVPADSRRHARRLPPAGRLRRGGLRCPRRRGPALLRSRDAAERHRRPGRLGAGRALGTPARRAPATSAVGRGLL